jgi:hypothetical protein
MVRIGGPRGGDDRYRRLWGRPIVWAGCGETTGRTASCEREADGALGECCAIDRTLLTAGDITHDGARHVSINPMCRNTAHRALACRPMAPSATIGSSASRRKQPLQSEVCAVTSDPARYPNASLYPHLSGVTRNVSSQAHDLAAAAVPVGRRTRARLPASARSQIRHCGPLCPRAMRAMARRLG